MISITIEDGGLDIFEDLREYLEMKTTRAFPIIVQLPDVITWPETRRQKFVSAYGGPNVGIECPWPGRWLPGNSDREVLEE